MKTLERTPAAKANKSEAITITPFTVPVQWVEVEVQIPADLAACLESRAIHVLGDYGSYVQSIASEVTTSGRPGYTPAEIIARLKNIPGRPLFIESDLMAPRGKRLRPFTVHMEAWCWEHVTEAAALLGVTPPAFVRAALYERRRSLLRFDESQAASAKGGQA